MVVRDLSVVAALVLIAAGCGDPLEKDTQKTTSLTVDQQIANIEKTNMPDHVKQGLINDLKAREAQKK